MQIIITGISQGLGKALFDILATLDVDIIAISRRFTDDQMALVNEKPNIKLLKCDLSNLDEVGECLNDINIEGEVIFINNASTIGKIDNFGDINSSEIINTIILNYISPALIINKIAKSQLFILNISSGAANRAIDNWSLYCSTKSAIKMLTQVIGLEDNVEYINFDPGVMNTSMQKAIRNSEFKDVSLFREYYNKNVLKETTSVAKEIVDNYIKQRIQK